jgi:hypothetical protein
MMEKYGMKRCDSCQKLYPIEINCDCVPTVKSSFIASGGVLEKFTKLRQKRRYKNHGK